MGQCRIEEFSLLAASFEGEEPQDVQRCANRATELVIIGATRAGIKVYAHVPVCFTHDLVLNLAPGYVRTIEHHSRPDAAATSPTAGS